MMKILKHKYKICFALIILIVLSYFFWPKTFKSEEILAIIIQKEIEGESYTNLLNQKETSDFGKILEKSRFYRGVSRPGMVFANKSIIASIIGGPDIEIYYDTDKTYVYAYISSAMFPTVYYRISNKEEIRKFIETISNTKNAEFKKGPSYYHITD